MLSTAKLISFDKEMKFDIGDTDHSEELGQQSGQWGEGWRHIRGEWRNWVNPSIWDQQSKYQKRKPGIIADAKQENIEKKVSFWSAHWFISRILGTSSHQL